ncbi:MAG TPA: phage portal protein [Rhodocyclaceae bacterium]|nr:phage portal protein [Rhodocyclaceae bacterium]
MGLFSRLFRSADNPSEPRTAWLESRTQAVAAAVHGQFLQTQRTAQRSFETAETPAWTESWSTTLTPINESLAQQLPTLWARANGLARNNDWAQRYLIELDDNVLGPDGIRLQMGVMRPAQGDSARRADKDTNDALEAAFARWGDEADVSGMSWADIETLAINTLARRGEILYRHMPGRGPLGYQVQFIDPMLLDVTLNQEYSGRRIRMGIEIDDEGRPVAYWLQMSRSGDLPSAYVTVGRHVRVPADEIEHRFLIEEPGQLRGVPWLSVGARRLWMLHDFEQSAAVASANAAKRQGFFFSPSGEAPAGFADKVVAKVIAEAQAEGRELTEADLLQIQIAAERYATTMPGQFDTLPQGYQFQPFESKWPEVSAEGYIKGHVRAWAAGRGMSYVSIGNDLEAVNYSSAQVGILGEREHHKKTQRRLKRWLHTRVFPRLLPYLVLSDARLRPARIAEYLAAATWQGRRWAPLDPLKAARSNDIKLRNKTTSRHRVWLEDGVDPDELAAEIAQEEEMFGSLDAPQGTASSGGAGPDQDAD